METITFRSASSSDIEIKVNFYSGYAE